MSDANTVSAFIDQLQECSSRTFEEYSLFSDPRKLLVGSVAYVTIVFALQAYYRNGAASFAHKRGFVCVAATHNLLLSVFSLAMNVGATRAIAEEWGKGGLRATMCTARNTAHAAMPQSYQFWLYVFFLSKFYELFDTVLLVMRGRPLTLLHVWHHTSVVYMCWAFLNSNITGGIYAMWLNSFVHVIMYAYYAAALLKVPFRLKRVVTLTQIVQFCTGFALIIPFSYFQQTGPGCTGVGGLVFISAIGATYLMLFLRFYKNAYLLRKDRKVTKELAVSTTSMKEE